MRKETIKAEYILNVAKELFKQKGYEITMDEVAEKANVSKGVIYLKFKDKEDLFLAVVDTFIQELVKATEIDRTLPFEKAFDKMLENLNQKYVENINILKILGYDLVFSKTRGRKRKDKGLLEDKRECFAKRMEKFASFIDSLQRNFEVLIDKGINEGVIKELDAEKKKIAIRIILWILQGVHQEYMHSIISKSANLKNHSLLSEINLENFKQLIKNAILGAINGL